MKKVLTLLILPIMMMSSCSYRKVKETWCVSFYEYTDKTRPEIVHLYLFNPNDNGITKHYTGKINQWQIGGYDMNNMFYIFTDGTNLLRVRNK